MKLVIAFILFGACQLANSQNNDCQTIKDTSKRLTCYDKTQKAEAEAIKSDSAKVDAVCNQFEEKSNSLQIRLELGVKTPDLMYTPLVDAVQAFKAFTQSKLEPSKAAS